MTKELLDFITKYARHFRGLSGVPCEAFDVAGQAILSPRAYCAKCNGCEYGNTHKYGCFEAQRWNGRYIYYCPAGFIFIAVSLPDESGRIEAGVLSGPIVMGKREDFSADGTLPPEEVPGMSTARVNHMAELMAAVFIRDSHGQPEYESLLNDIYKVRDGLEGHPDYPIGLEKRLQSAIADGNKAQSTELLNQLLGHIFFCSNGDLDTIKARVLELIVLLSRSAIEGGAEVEQIFLLNKNYIDEVKAFDGLEELSRWLTGVIDRFISYVFEFSDIKHADILYKAMSYIKQNYREKLSLDDIAGHVHMSKSYLSKIFKDEMNCTLTNYINQVRVDKSKHFLLESDFGLVEIAYLCGFEDQSYFTKVFKKLTGVSPGRYKNSRGKKEL